VPQLSSQGYELVGGRLLPGGDGTAAQFVFHNPAGQRITLYLGATEATPATGGTEGGGAKTSGRHRFQTQH
jgi:anti-sigma factor RsiW